MTLTTTPEHYLRFEAYLAGGPGRYKAVCRCGFACTAKPTPEKAEAAVAAHIAKKA